MITAHFDDLFAERANNRLETKITLGINEILFDRNSLLSADTLVNGIALSELKGKLLLIQSHRYMFALIGSAEDMHD